MKVTPLTLVILCGKTFDLLKDLSDHIASEHSEVLPNNCDKCDQSFSLQSHLTNQRVTNHPPPPSMSAPLKCLKCDFKFEQFCDLSEHIKTFHDPNMFYPYAECELAFPTRLYLETHIVNKRL